MTVSSLEYPVSRDADTGRRPEKSANPIEETLKESVAVHKALNRVIRQWIAALDCHSALVEITVFKKDGGPLTKRISLSKNGELISDGSGCVMSAGCAWRAAFGSLAFFAEFISDLRSDQAIALGTFRDGLPESVHIVTKRRLGGDDLGNVTVARTSQYIGYRPGVPALALIDVDLKSMPAAVRKRVKKCGGILRALISVLPELASVGRVIRRSTSACILRDDTGEAIARSSGFHIYVLVQDGADIERFLRTLHERCRLHGFGWKMFGAVGQLLDRSIVDQTVYAAERLVFEGPPRLALPLMQDQRRRRAKAMEGPPLDTVAACPPLRLAEKVQLTELRAMDAHRLAPVRAEVRERFVNEHASRIAEQTGVTIETARHMVGCQTGGVLLPDLVLPFDDPEFQGCTLRDVLSDPARFDGATLADPLEGLEYGRCKAEIMRRSDGSLWIHSFAHGRTTYELKYDAAYIETTLKDTPVAEMVHVFATLAFDADLQGHERERLRNDISARTGINKRTIDNAIKQAEKRREADHAREEKDRRIAERRDPRPQVPVPLPDEPFLSQVELLNDILGKSTAAEPPARDIDGYLVQVRTRPPTGMHTLTAQEANSEAADDNRLPPPEHLLLTRLDQTAVAELIELHIDYADQKDRSVHLPAIFVSHLIRRSDGALPIASSVATLPIVLPDGTIFSGIGLHRVSGIVFRIPEKVLALIPAVSDCASTRVAEAMDFLVNRWLCDVTTDYEGKCKIISVALSIIERSIFSEQPAFFVSAGQRGGGKTTLVHMIATATTGTRAAAAGFSMVSLRRGPRRVGD